MTTPINYSLGDLIDLQELKALFQDLSAATGFSIDMVDNLSKETVCSTGLREICERFHLKYPLSRKRCEIGSRCAADSLCAQEDIKINFCKNGLVHDCTPIVAGKRHLATLYTGQILFAPPDLKYFRQQAKEVGFDEEEYLAAVEKVPVISKEKFTAMLRYLAHFSTLLAKTGLERMEKTRISQQAMNQKTLLDSLINSTPDLISYKDQRSVYMGCNTAFAELTGRTEQELVGKTDFDLFPFEIAEFFQEMDHAMLASGSARRNEEWVTYPDGRKVLFDTLKTAYIGPDGEVQGLIGISRDITHMKSVEKELADKHKALRMLADNLPDMVWAKDLEGRYLFTNRAVCDDLLMAVDVDEPIGKTDMFFAQRERQRHPDRPDWHTFGEMCVNSDDVTLQHMHPMRFEEFGNIRGEFLYLEVHKAPFFDNEGNLIGTVGSARDIGTLKKLEREVATEREQLLVTLQSIGDGVITTNLDSRIILLNGVAEKLTGWSQKEATGQKLSEVFQLIDEQTGAAYDNPVDRVLQKNAAIGLVNHTILVTRDGSRRAITHSGAPIHTEDGQILGVVLVFRDVTAQLAAEAEQRRLETQLQRSQQMEAIGVMAGGVAHDLNNILSGIVGYPELLLMQLPGNSPLRPFAEAIGDSGRLAAAVVADLLTVARGAAASKEVHNLNRLITKFLGSPELMAISASHPRVQLHTELAEDLLNLHCSASHIHKCLINLVLNAHEATKHQGKIVIRTANRYVDLPLKGYADVRQGEYVVLSVSDSGEGIGKEDLGHIFEPFYTKKVMGKSGTGLGLAVVWNAVRDHDGYIDVQTGPTGTTFELYFPACRGEERAEPSPVQDCVSGRGESILIVDDEAAQLEIATAFLQTLGYQTHTASSGEEAIAWLQNNRADLLLLDMIMSPGINGRETYEKIVARYPGQKAVIASGFTQTDEVQRTQELGAGRFIAKPYTLSLLSRAVREELDKNSVQEQ